MKNTILTFTLERQSKDQEWGLSLVGGWMEGQWIQVSQVSKKSYLLYIFTRVTGPYRPLILAPAGS